MPLLKNARPIIVNTLGGPNMQDARAWLPASTAVNPTAPALIIGNHQWSYTELNQLAQRAAFWLQAKGIQPKDRVAVLMSNCLEYVCLVHAASLIGAVLVPLNIRLTAPELAWQINQTGSKLLVYTPEFADKVAECSQLENLEASHLLREIASPENGEVFFQLQNTAGIIFTSGTSGQPKGVTLTYENFLWSALASANRLGTLPADGWLCCLPLYHVGGLSIIQRCCLYGTTAILQNGFDLAKIQQAFDTASVTLISLVPTMLYRMINEGVKFPSSLRLILLGGAAASPELIEKCQALNLPIAPTYGLTEACSQVATMLPTGAFQKPGSVAKPLLFSSVDILNSAGNPCEPYEYGDIVVQGPTVMTGYWENAEATHKAIRARGLYTGDIGYLDSDGDIWVVQRRTDLIVSGGENIYPAEIENVLRKHPAVADCCAIGIADAEWGQVVGAAVTFQAGMSTDATDLEAFCRQALAGYKIPRRWRFVDQLPQNATGKIQRNAVAALFQ